MPRNKNQKPRATAQRHIDWRKIRTYRATYELIHPGPGRGRKATVIVTQVHKPPKRRTFNTGHGLRKYKLVRLQTKITEVIVVAKGRKKVIEDEELEELEALEDLEDLDDLEDEEEDEEEVEEEDEEEDDEEEEDEEDEDEDEEEEEPAPKSRRKKTTTAKAKPAPRRGSRPDDGKVGTAEVAEHFGVDGRTLRILLRKHNIPKDEDSNQYRWSSLRNKEVIRIGKLIAQGEAKKAKSEQLDNLKERRTAKKSTKTTTTTAKKKKRAA